MPDRPSFGTVRPPHTAGIDLLEQALHALDTEATKYLSDKALTPELLLRMGQVEHCFSILFEAMARHLPEEVRDFFPLPAAGEPFQKAVIEFMRAQGYDVDAA